jgi:diguanylate cyclase (GGDEF)-like protein
MNKLSKVIIAVLVITLAFNILGGTNKSIFVNTGLIIGILCFMFLMRGKLRKKKSTAPDESQLPPEPPILTQTQKKVDESITNIDLSVIGTEYRRKEQKEFEENIDGILNKCIKLIHSHVDSHTAAIFFPSHGGGYKIRQYVSKSDLVDNNAVIHPGVGVIGSFLKDGLERIKLTDIVTDSKTLYYYKHDAGIHSLIASPITVEKVVRGLIIIDSTEKDHFSEEDHAYLSAMAELCGRAVYHSYLYNQHRLDYERLVAMSSTEKYFFQEHSIDAVLDKLIEIIPFAFQCNRLSISLFDKENETAVIKRVWGQYLENLANLTFSINEKSIANIVITKNLSLFRNFSEEHYEIRYHKDEPQADEFRSFLAFPLGVDKCKGMILLESMQKNTYAESNRSLLSRLVSSAGVAIEKIDILKQTENLAIRDGLTGLYNHRQFQLMLKEAITRSIRYKTNLTLVIGDIDHFKKLNDTYGHRFGDEVLKVIASKLQASIREGIDNTARYGGEEFALILAETDASSAKETVDRIRQSIADMVFQSPRGKEIHCTMSFGIAVYGVHAKNQELLIKRADKALYKAKENGRNRVELYLETQ